MTFPHLSLGMLLVIGNYFCILVEEKLLPVIYESDGNEFQFMFYMNKQ